MFIVMFLVLDAPHAAYVPVSETCIHAPIRRSGAFPHVPVMWSLQLDVQNLSVLYDFAFVICC